MRAIKSTFAFYQIRAETVYVAQYREMATDLSTQFAHIGSPESIYGLNMCDFQRRGSEMKFGLEQSEDTVANEATGMRIHAR